MRLLIILIVVILIAGVVVKNTGILDSSTFASRIKKPVEKASAIAPLTGSPQLRQDDHSDSEEKDVTTVYHYENRPAVESQGSVDRGGNFVIKQVSPDRVETQGKLDQTLDIPLERRHVHLAMVEFSVNAEDAFSLSTFADNLVSEIGSSSTSILSAGQSTFTVTNQAANVLQILLHVADDALRQATPSGRSRTLFSGSFWLTTGIDMKFDDYAEQITPQTTTTQTSTTQDVSTRRVGLSVTFHPTITSKWCSVQYLMDNSQPTSSVTASGTTLAGEFMLKQDAIFLLDAEHIGETRERSHLLGIPVGYSIAKVRKLDLIIVEPYNESQGHQAQRSVLVRGSSNYVTAALSRLKPPARARRTK